MKLWLLACIGGGLGAGMRFLIGVGVANWIGLGGAIPWATLSVNVLGSACLGIAIEVLALREGGLGVRTFFIVGVLGGFTTFSAFSLEVAGMLMQKQEMIAGAYILLSVGLSVLALFAGLHLTRLFLF